MGLQTKNVTIQITASCLLPKGLSVVKGILRVSCLADRFDCVVFWQRAASDGEESAGNICGRLPIKVVCGRKPESEREKISASQHVL